MRELTQEALTALQGANVPLVLLLEMGYSTPVLFASSAVNIDWDGKTFLGIGTMGRVQPAVDTNSGETTGISFELSGIPSENVSLFLGESARGKACRLSLAILDPETHAILDVSRIFTGTLDQTTVAVQNGSATIAVTAEHIGKVFGRPKPLRFNQNDQQRLYPGDTSMRFIPSQSQKKDTWPAASFFRQ